MAESGPAPVANLDAGGRAPRRLTRRHAWAALLTALPFVLLVLGVTGRPLIALGTVLGPMAGPVAREWQSCCAQFGFEVLPLGLGSLALAFATQWLPFAAWGGRPRLAGWVLGIAGWCCCGLVSYAHALE